MYNNEQLAKLDPVVARRIRIEQKVIRKLIGIVFSRGYAISVNDGEEWVLHRSQSSTAVCDAMMSTDEDMWRIGTATGGRIGKVWFVYGNDGYDVVSDYTVNPEMDRIMGELQPYLDKLERGEA